MPRREGTRPTHRGGQRNSIARGRHAHGYRQADRVRAHHGLDTQTQSLDKCITIQHQDNLKLLKMVERLLELGHQVEI